MQAGRPGRKAPAVPGPEDGHGGLSPKARVDAAAAPVPGERKRVGRLDEVPLEVVAFQGVVVGCARPGGVGADRRDPLHGAVVKVDAKHLAGKENADDGRMAVRPDGDPRDHAGIVGGKHPHGPLRGDPAASESKEMEHSVARPAAHQGPSVGGEGQSLEALVDRPRLDDASGRQVDNPDLVPSVAAVKNRGVTPGGIEREAEREITEPDLPARRPDGPLVVQQGRPVGLQARKHLREGPTDQGRTQGEKDSGGEDPD